jgi:hypothetical protein
MPGNVGRIVTGVPQMGRMAAVPEASRFSFLQ